MKKKVQKKKKGMFCNKCGKRAKDLRMGMCAKCAGIV